MGGDQNLSFSAHTLYYTSPNSGHHIQEINGSGVEKNQPLDFRAGYLSMAKK